MFTRDLLRRAARAQPAEKQALQFRALHLNLPLVREVADGLGLTASERPQAEHLALDGLARAVGSFDPEGPEEFADYAVPLVEREIAVRLRRISPQRG